jgi:hypothetical protein
LQQQKEAMSESGESYKLLMTINGPEDMKSLSPEDLRQLSSELRQYIIEVVSSNPGHFGASLGVVELTVAIHHIFNAPYDQIVWDVGHQAYGHKILTGRREVFHTNRKYGGISSSRKTMSSLVKCGPTSNWTSTLKTAKWTITLFRFHKKQSESRARQSPRRHPRPGRDLPNRE